MKFLFLRSIRTKLATMISLFIGAISLFIYLYFPSKQADQAMQAIIEKTQSIAEMSAYSVSSAIVFDDVSGAEETIRSAQQNKDIMYFVITHANGDIFASFNRPIADSYFYRLTEHQNGVSKDGLLYQASAPIYQNQIVIGYLYVGISLDEVLQNTNASRKAIAIMSIIIFIVGIVTVFGLSSVITRSLGMMVETFDHIASGDMTKRSPIDTGDEVGHLARSFNVMVDKVAATRAELEEANQTLEQRVEERTKALQNEIIERQRIAEAFRESEAKYRSLVELSPDAIFIHSDGKFIFANSAGVGLLGAISERDLIGRSIMEYIHSDYHAIDEERVRHIMLHRTEAPLIEERFIRSDGTMIDVEVTAIPFIIGGDVAVQVIARDITERKLGDQKIAASERKFRTLFETAKDGILLLHRNRIIDCNQKLEEIYAAKREQLLYRRLFELSPITQPDGGNSAERSQEYIACALANEPQFFEWKHIRFDGRTFDAEVSLNRVEIEGEIMLQAIVRDITERKQAERELREAKEHAEQSDKLKDSFIANMSHEIRTPLNIIMGYANLIESVFEDRMRPDELEYFKSIERSGKRLMRTVEQILNISSIHAGTFTTSPSMVKINKEVDDLANDMLGFAAEKGLQLRVVHDTIDVEIYIDRYTLMQTLTNLIDNAIKFTEAGGVTVRIFTANEELVLTVNDTGIGMSDEYLPQVFNEFSQETIGYTRPFEGLGLGLALTKRYVEFNKGSIEVHSVKGQGTTFTLRFPLRVEADIDERAESGESIMPIYEGSSGSTRASILIVEDDVPTLQYMRRMLTREYMIHTADTAEVAWDILTSENIDLILLDISLHGSVDGLDFAKVLRGTEQYRHLPIIVVTAHAFPDDRIRSLEAGADEYIAKPFHLDHLLMMVRKYLHLHRMRMES